MIKLYLEAIVLVSHVYSCFYRKSKYSKVLNGDVHGTTTGPSCGMPRGPNDRKYIKLAATNTLNLMWQVIQDFMANDSSKKFIEQYAW